MSKAKWTVMIVPHDDDRVRSVQFSSSGVRAFLGAVLLVVMLSGVFTVGFFVQLHTGRSAAPRDVENELAMLSEAIEQRLADANRQIVDLSTERREREEELAALQRQYEAVAGLMEGQEEIARAHRAILSQRTWTERLIDQVWAFLTGILATIVTQLVVLRPRISIDSSG